jgi:perosamine synthetase
VFAFYPNKQITTGEGGCIVTNDKRLANLCRSMRNQGRAVPGLPACDGKGVPSDSLSAMNAGHAAGANGTPEPATSSASVGAWLAHDRLGYNYRLDEMSAALGVGQMRRLDEIIHKRQHVASAYMQKLMHVEHLILPTVMPGTEMSWFVFVVRLDSTYTKAERDRIIMGMRRHDIGASDYFPCIHLQPFYRERFGYEPGMYPIAESVSQRTIALPFYGDLEAKDQEMVCQTLDHMVARENLSR